VIVQRPPEEHQSPRRDRLWTSIARERRFGLSGDAVMRWLVRFAGVAVIVMLAALLIVLFNAARPSMAMFGWSFLTSSEWQPNERQVLQRKRDADGKVLIVDGEVQYDIVKTLPMRFGALPVIYGTAVSSTIALIFAVPLSLGAALFLVRVAPRLRIAGPVSFLIEFLAAIPSIAYGIWALFVLGPFLQTYFEPRVKAALGEVPAFRWLFEQQVTIGSEVSMRPLSLSGFDMLCGGLILGIMILPIITAVSRDVLKAVPRAQIEGTQALGATWWQSCREMLRYSRSGLFGAVMLGLARAAGETMAVTMVIGNSFQIAVSPFAPAYSMSSLLANEFAEASSPLHRSALIEVALILLVMSLMFNVVARYLVVGKGARTAAAH
jgi:phosphate transport system permease protein